MDGSVKFTPKQWRKLFKLAKNAGSDKWWWLYSLYLKSNAWKRKKAERKSIDGGRCTTCSSTEALQVHHLSYANVGDEDVQNDLKTLCTKCHKAAHGKGKSSKTFWTMKELVPMVLEDLQRRMNRP